MRNRFLLICLLASLSSSAQNSLFKLLPESQSGIRFKNVLKPTETQNILTQGMPYLISGGGVGIGDFNNDSLPDIFLIGNQVNAALYMNRGNMQFEDRTQAMGISTTEWCSGVALADVNGDGWLDIYITRAQNPDKTTGGNLLFMNEKGKKFTERSKEFNLQFNDRFMCASFFDFDLDGDMDLYLPRYPDNTKTGNDINFDFNKTFKKGFGTDLLLENINNKTFADITAKAGIMPENGFGISVLTNDFNNDGYPDIYIGNDFSERDFLYINNKDKTFSEVLQSKFAHTSFFTMGADYADLNNDLRPDLLTLDMNPPSLEKYKTDFTGFDFDIYKKSKENYYNQEIRNCLQMQNADGTYSDIGQIDKVAFTDWSWSALMADFDLDGLRDIFITNGLHKDVLNQNLYLFKLDSIFKNNGKGWGNISKLETLGYIGSMPLPNYFFKNLNGLRMSDYSARWAEPRPSVSTGAAVADLDLDGDLDMIVNNIDTFPFLYQNLARQQSAAHFITMQVFRGKSPAIGTKAILYASGKTQLAEAYTSRGFTSSSPAMLHFGLDTLNSIDSVVLLLPGNSGRVTFNQPAIDQTLFIDLLQYEPKPEVPSALSRPQAPALTPLVQYPQQPDRKNDFKYQPLLLQEISTPTPAIAIHDLNGDGRQDILVGAFNKAPAYCLLQQTDGSFAEQHPKAFDNTAGYNWNKIYINDLNNDKQPEIVAACTDFYFTNDTTTSTSQNYLPIFSIENHTTVPDFVPFPGAVPVHHPVSCAAIADIDRDGWTDMLAFGGTSLTLYPQSYNVHLLMNNKAVFTDSIFAPAKINRDLGRMLFTDAGITDIDNDQYPELFFTGPYLRTYMLRNTRGDLNNPLMSADNEGLWSKVVNADLNQNGEPDAISLNMGLNWRFNLQDEEKFSLVTFDYDNNFQLDPLLCATKDEKHYPIYTFKDFFSYFPYARKKTYDYTEYSRASLTTIFDPARVNAANIRSIRTTQSGIKLENGTRLTLPPQLQWTLLNDALIDTAAKVIYFGGNNLHMRHDMGYQDAAALLVAPYHNKGGMPVMDPVTVFNYPQTEVRQLFFITIKGEQRLLLNTNRGIYTHPR